MLGIDVFQLSLMVVQGVLCNPQLNFIVGRDAWSHSFFKLLPRHLFDLGNPIPDRLLATPVELCFLSIENPHDSFIPVRRKQDRKSTRLNFSHVKISYAV